MASTMFLCFFLLLLLIGSATSPDQNYVALSPNFHLGILNDGLDSKIVCFNDAKSGPYRGSIIGFTGDEYPHTIAFGSSFGIYYRHFEWPDSTLWTLMVSLWYPITVAALLPAGSVVLKRRNRTSIITT